MSRLLLLSRVFEEVLLVCLSGGIRLELDTGTGKGAEIPLALSVSEPCSQEYSYLQASCRASLRSV